MSAAISMEVTGVARLSLAIDKRTKGYANGVARGIVKFAELILEESRKIVPVDEYVLHDTSKVRTSGRGFEKKAEVVYDQEYAAIQHENLDYKHKPGRSAKYLERPLRRFKAKGRKIIAEEARHWRKR